MFTKLNAKYQRYATIFGNISNWPSYLAFKMGVGRTRDFTFHFRDGNRYRIPKNMMGPFRECFFDNQYMKAFDAATFPDRPVILDIGANVGYAALYFFSRFPRAVVHSFEPMPYMVEQCRHYQQAFPQYAWHIHPYGIWKEEGEMELFTTSTDGFSTVSGMIARPDADKRIRVKMRSLCQFLQDNNIERVDLLKLDCEGAEYDILFGLQEEDFARIPRIAMETHVTDTFRMEDMVDFLRGKGYTVTAADGTTTGKVWAWKGIGHRL